MSNASHTARIEGLADELIALMQAQAADLREYAQAAAVGEGTVHLERTLRRRELQRAALYQQFERAAFTQPPSPDLVPQT